MTDTNQTKAADIECVKSILTDLQIPEGTYNDHQVNLLAEGYTLKIFLDAEFTKEDYFMWLSDPEVGPFERKFLTVIGAMVKEKQSEAIERVGWALIYVGPSEVDTSFTYSVGLTSKTGFELVSVGLPSSHAQGLMNTTIQRVLDGEITLGEVFTDKDFHIAGNPMRAKIVDLDMDSLTARGVKGRTDGVTVVAIKQLWVGDKNNRLPDELGYDQQCVQELEES